MKLNRLFLRLLVTVSLITSGLANAQSNGDPNKFSTAQENPSCQVFDGFSDQGNGTIVDPRNGLMWKICPEGRVWNNGQCKGEQLALNIKQAETRAKNANYFGKKDWRLPTLSELAEIVGAPASCKKNARDSVAIAQVFVQNHGSMLQDKYYAWTSTQQKGGGGQFNWVKNLKTGANAPSAEWSEMGVKPPQIVTYLVREGGLREASVPNTSDVTKGDVNKYSISKASSKCEYFDGYIVGENGILTDPRSDLEWQRCLVGQSWINGQCRGDAKKLNWFDAMRQASGSKLAGKSDWRLPSKEELKNAFGNNCLRNDGGSATSTLFSSTPFASYSIWAFDADTLNGSNRWYASSVAGFYDHRGERNTVSTSLGPENLAHTRLVRKNDDALASGLFAEQLRFAAANGSKHMETVENEIRENDRRRREYQEKLEAHRAQLRREREIGASRNGVSRTTFLDVTRAWGIHCNNGYSTISSLDKNIGYCGSASNGEHKCDFTLGVVAAHICR